MIYFGRRTGHNGASWIEAGIRGCDSFGWQLGDDGYSKHTHFLLSVCGLNLLGFTLFKRGFEVWFLGFWWIV